MGFTPQQVDGMSLWQFAAACEGVRKANDPDSGKALTRDEEERLWALVEPQNGH